MSKTDDALNSNQAIGSDKKEVPIDPSLLDWVDAVANVNNMSRETALHRIIRHGCRHQEEVLE